jgi:acetoin utilization deacetylase AcuC-like enzyme
MSLIVFSSDRFAEHQTPPGHPESPARARVLSAVANEWRRRGAIHEPSAATDDQLARVHAPRYLQQLAGVSGRPTALDPDTFTSPETIDVARLAAGAAVDAVHAVLDGESSRALALVRPPGHHAERDRAMGFCFYNNIAVAAAEARARGLDRVAIVDYDVHHGNGTEHMFASDPHVLYISTHQYPYYPGTGAADDVGTGAGRGFTVNVPLEAGATDADYALVFRDVVTPVLDEYAPQLILISAGFDAHARDPLAAMRLSTESFAAMTGDLCAVADRHAGGRLVAITEGGYDLGALEASLLAVLDVLAADDGPPWPGGDDVNARGQRAINLVRRAQTGFWKLTE